MPDGRVQRIDESRELVYIVRRGRTYAAEISEVDTHARVPSVWVQFDVTRRDGSESATNVRLRSGSRTNRRHRRFADLTGAKKPGSKIKTTANSAYGIDVATQPFKVAEALIDALANQNFDDVTALFAPRASLHLPAESGTGRPFVRAGLESPTFVGLDPESVEIRGEDRYVRVDYSTGSEEHTTFLEIERGSIIAQWVDVFPEMPDDEESEKEFQFVLSGEIPDGARGYAENKIRHLEDHLDLDADFVEVKLSRAKNPSIPDAAAVEAVLDFGSWMVRAHHRAETFNEATDKVADRLSVQLRHQRERQQDKTDLKNAAPVADPGPGRGQSAGAHDLVPEGLREIVRHKSLAAGDSTIDEAAWDMSLMDYDFFLFTELESGQDSVLFTDNDGGLALQYLGEAPEKVDVCRTEFNLIKAPAPKLAVSQAINLLDTGGDALVFFENSSTGRGNVIYRRFDGHYGLITPDA